MLPWSTFSFWVVFSCFDFQRSSVLSFLFCFESKKMKIDQWKRKKKKATNEFEKRQRNTVKTLLSPEPRIDRDGTTHTKFHLFLIFQIFTVEKRGKRTNSSKSRKKKRKKLTFISGTGRLYVLLELFCSLFRSFDKSTILRKLIFRFTSCWNENKRELGCHFFFRSDWSSMTWVHVSRKLFHVSLQVWLKFCKVFLSQTCCWKDIQELGFPFCVFFNKF